MRVAQIIDQIKVGGAETLQHTFASHAHHYDVDVSVIGLHLQSTEMLEKIQSAGAEVHIFEGRSLSDPSRILALYRFLRQKDFDIIHTHLNYANILGVILARLLGIPVIVTLHNEKMRKGKSGWLERQIIKQGAKRVIAVGYLVADSHTSWLDEKRLLVIPNAVSDMPVLSPDEQQQTRSELVGNPDLKILICVGRFTEQKGYPDLIEAFEKVNQAMPDTRLVIVGKGTLFEETQQLIHQKNLQDVIILTGLRYDVPRLLASSDMYVNASWWEGLPVTVLEAMSAGLPLVVTNVGDTPNVVVEGTGILVPPHQPVQLAHEMIQLLGNPDLLQQVGTQARQHVHQNFGAQAWVKRLTDLYREVIEEAQ